MPINPNYDYLVKLSFEEGGKTVDRSVVLTSSEELNTKQIDEKASEIFELARGGKSSVIDWIVVQSQEDVESGSGAKIKSIRKIALEKQGITQKRGYVSLFSNLALKWPKWIPVVNLVWAFGICPFLALHQWLGEGKRVARGNLEDFYSGTNVDSYDKFLNLLNIFQSRFEKGATGEVADVVNHLNQAVVWGKDIDQGLHSREGVLFKTIESICQTLTTVPECTEEGALLGMIPVGTVVEGQFYPMMISVLHHERGVELLFHQWGENRLSALEDSYVLSGDDLEKRLFGVLTGALQPAMSKEVFSMSKGEEEKLKAVKKMAWWMFPEMGDTEALLGLDKKAPSLTLHERIISLGGQVKQVHPDSVKSHSSFYLMMQHDLKTFFPEAPIHEKLEYLLSMIQDEADRYLDAEPYLSPEEKRRVLRQLSLRIEKFEREAVKTLGGDALKSLDKSGVFQRFNQTVSEIRERYEQIDRTIPLGKEQELSDEKVSRSESYQTRIAPSQIERPRDSKTVKKKGKAVVDTRELDVMIKGIDIAQPDQIAIQLGNIHVEIDKLIEQKEYLLASQYATKALEKLPVPTQDFDFSGWGDLDQLSMQITALTKDIWESTIRLNLPSGQPDQLTQVMKGQIYVLECLRTAYKDKSFEHFNLEKSFDYKEMLLVIERDPFIRFGWLPNQKEQIRKIREYLKKESKDGKDGKDRKVIVRYDLRYDLKRPCSSLPVSGNRDDDESLYNGLIDLRRSQLMFTSLVQPYSAFWPHMPGGIWGLTQFLRYLVTFTKASFEAMKAVNLEDEEAIKSMNRRVIQKNHMKMMQTMKQMNRLEIVGSENTCEKLTPYYLMDPTGKSNQKVSYAPNFKEEVFDYGDNCVSFTQDYAGVVVSVNEYIGIKDDEKMKPEYRDVNIQNTLPTQKKMTEPALLRQALRTNPKHMISQMDRYGLQGMEFATRDDTIEGATEILTTFLSQKHQWTNPVAQRTLLLALTREGVIEKDLKDNPEFFTRYSKRLSEIIKDKKLVSSEARPFLITIGHLLKREMESQSVDYKGPAFDSEVKIGETDLTGIEWIHEWMRHGEGDDVENAMALLYGHFETEDYFALEKEKQQDILYALMIFSFSSQISGLPQFNDIVKDHYQTNFLLPFKEKIQDEEFLQEFMNGILHRFDPSIKNQTWVYNEKSGVITCDQASFNLHSLQFQIKGQKERGIKIDIPFAVKNSDSFLSLFGDIDLKARFSLGATAETLCYDFSHDVQEFCIQHNKSSGEVKIFQKMATNPLKPKRREWYQYVQVESDPDQKKTAIEGLMESKELWVRCSKRSEGFIKGDRGDLYAVKFNSQGVVQRVTDPILGLQVVLDRDEAFASHLPFAPSNEMILLANSSGDIKEIRLLFNQARLIKAKDGKWQLSHEKMGKGIQWLTNRSGRDLKVADSQNIRKVYQALGPQAEKFLIPLKTKEGIQFLLVPHPIVKTSDPLAPYHVQADEMFVGGQDFPLVLSVNEEGKISGSPTSYLYLSYYYSTQKDYDRALKYLEEAKKAYSDSRDDERAQFEQCAALFDSHPDQTLRSIGFQLKAQLAIRQIRKETFASETYDPSQLDRYFHHIQKLHDLYDIYQDKIQKSDHWKLQVESQDLLLSETEQFQIKGLINQSMKDFSEHYIKQTLEASPYREEAVEKLPDINLKEALEYSEELFLSLLILGEGLDKPKTFEELVKPGYVTEGAVLRNYFHYYSWLVAGSPKEKGKLQQMLQFLLQDPSWTGSEDSETTKLARKAREHLIATAYLALEIGVKDELNREAMMGSFKSMQKQVSRTMRAAGYLNVIKISGFELGSLFAKYGHKIHLSDMEGVQKNLQDLILYTKGDSNSYKKILTREPDEAENPASQNLDSLRERAGMPKRVKKEEGSEAPTVVKGLKGLTSFKAICEYLGGLSDEERAELPYLGVEIKRYLDLLKTHESVDEESKAIREQPIDLAKFVADPSIDFLSLSIRTEAELMKQITKLETELSHEEVVKQKKTVKLDVHVAERLTLKKVMLKDPLPLEPHKKPEELLSDRVDELKRCFHPESVDDPIEKEEFAQISKGIDEVKGVLEQELSEKSTLNSSEIKLLRGFVRAECDEQKTESLKALQSQKKKALLKLVKTSESLPPSLKKMQQKPELYTEHEQLTEIIRIYKDFSHEDWLNNNDRAVYLMVTEYLLYTTAVQQLSKAREILEKKDVSGQEAAKAYQMIQGGINLTRYLDEENQTLMRKCLAAEAREGIIFRPRQLEVIKTLVDDPAQWCSLRMGIGKTSYIMPTLADILAGQGKLPVLTVPEHLLQSNRSSFDRTTRNLFDRAGVLFSVPMQANLDVPVIAEMYEQLLRAKKRKGYIVTTVEELCSLDNTIIQLENQQVKLLGQIRPVDIKGKSPASGVEPNEMADDSRQALVLNEKRLHYFKKMAQLIHGESEEFAIPAQFFGDEVDYTANITHEVNLAIGEKVDPDENVRRVTRTLLEALLKPKEEYARRLAGAGVGGLEGPTDAGHIETLRSALLRDTQTILSDDEITTSLMALARYLQEDKDFLNFFDEENSKVLMDIDRDEWAAYITCQENASVPKGLFDDLSGEKWQEIVGATRQLLGVSFKSLLGQKAGIDYGLSDTEGFMVVPKVCKNETPGMRFGDEFELIVAQYLGYFAYCPSKSLTDSSDQFMGGAVKLFKDKKPSLYQNLLEEFKTASDDEPLLTLMEYLEKPEAFPHRWNILDSIVFEGGYIKRFDAQVAKNVQDVHMIHRNKQVGGVTGTLDTYTLPFIDSDKQFSEDKSTRAVEAETLLRMCLNHEKGINTELKHFKDTEALDHIRHLLADKETTAIINNSGVTTEGLNTLSWIKELRKTEEGQKRSFLFMHPEKRVIYEWKIGSDQPVPYKGGPIDESTICMYAPSDTRGVDMPIRKGKVQLILGPTTSTQDFMQSVYRARKLGGDHQVFIHVSDSLYDKIEKKSRTYAGAIKYILHRSTGLKKELNLKAEIHKVQGQLHACAMQFCREDNPALSKPESWDSMGPDFFEKVKVKSRYFLLISDLFIKTKQIDYGLCLEPNESCSGVEKVLETYKQLIKQVEALAAAVAEIEEEEGSLGRKLNALLESLRAGKEKFLAQQEKHEKFLPEKTVKSAAGSSGTFERVMEIQQVKAKEIETETEGLGEFNDRIGEKRSYKYFNKQHIKNLEEPFDKLYISQEAEDVLNVFNKPAHLGPKLYVVIIRDKGPCLITKQDYRKALLNKTIPVVSARGGPHYKPPIYALDSFGYTHIYGPESGLSEEEISMMMTLAKIYLGGEGFSDEEIKNFKKHYSEFGTESQFMSHMTSQQKKIFSGLGSQSGV